MSLNNLLTSTYIPQFDEWSNKYGYDNLVNALTQGLNLGDKGIADWQQLNNIRIPQTQTDIDLARAGLFNDGLPNMENNYLSASADKQPTKFDNLLMGYRDNYINPIGRTGLPAEKNWQTRLGEGLGTVGRFIDSPLGRGLIATGLNKAMGYDNSWQEGLTAAVGRQNAMTADKLYRKQLEQEGIDTSNITGNITNDMYKNISLGNYRNKNLDVRMQIASLKDNTSRAKFIGTLLDKDMITPEQAVIHLTQYGIPLETLSESNQTKLRPYKEYMYSVAPQVALGGLGVRQASLEETKKQNIISNAQRDREIDLKEKKQQEDEILNDIIKQIKPKTPASKSSGTTKNGTKYRVIN